MGTVWIRNIKWLDLAELTSLLPNIPPPTACTTKTSRSAPELLALQWQTSVLDAVTLQTEIVPCDVRTSWWRQGGAQGWQTPVVWCHPLKTYSAFCWMTRDKGSNYFHMENVRKDLLCVCVCCACPGQISDIKKTCLTSIAQCILNVVALYSQVWLLGIRVLILKSVSYGGACWFMRIGKYHWKWLTANQDLVPGMTHIL